MLATDVESELSYAYLHAVASCARFECEVSGRLSDNEGVDARVHVFERFEDAILTDFSIEIQLKATRTAPKVVDGRYSFGKLKVHQYDKLRNESATNQKLFVVLYLPDDHRSWLKCTDRQLTLKRCAYWTSLRGAPATSNDSNVTVYLPKSNRLSPESLRSIAAKRAQREFVTYGT